MFWRCIRFRVAIKSKFDPIFFRVVKVVTIVLGPDNVKTPTRARAEAGVDSETQFRLRIEPVIERVMADEWFSVEKEITDCNQRFVIDRTCIAQQTSHIQTTTFLASEKLIATFVR